MKLERARLHAFRLALVAPLGSAGGTMRVRRGWLVELENDHGQRGYGQALPLPRFGSEDATHCRTALAQLLPELLAQPEFALCEILQWIERAPAAARAALDAALHDLEGQRLGLPVAALLSPCAKDSPRPLAWLLSGEAPQDVESEARSAVQAGFAALKLKLGADPAQDVARLRAVRNAIGSRASLRLDANGAWSEGSALAHLEVLSSFEPEFVEQPIAPGDPEALARLRARSPVRLAADEDVRDERSAARLLDLGAADLLVLKPGVLGGLRPALRIAERARAAGVPVVVTGLIDSAFGVAAALHLDAALAGKLEAGLATSRLLAMDLARAPSVERGAMQMPEGAGLGITPSAQALERCADAPVLELRRSCS